MHDHKRQAMLCCMLLALLVAVACGPKKDGSINTSTPAGVATDKGTAARIDSINSHSSYETIDPKVWVEVSYTAVIIAIDRQRNLLTVKSGQVYGTVSFGPDTRVTINGTPATLASLKVGALADVRVTRIGAEKDHAQAIDIKVKEPSGG